MAVAEGMASEPPSPPPPNTCVRHIISAGREIYAEGVVLHECPGWPRPVADTRDIHLCCVRLESAWETKGYHVSD